MKQQTVWRAYKDQTYCLTFTYMLALVSFTFFADFGFVSKVNYCKIHYHVFEKLYFPIVVTKFQLTNISNIE